MKFYSLIFAIFISLALFSQVMAQGTVTVDADDTLDILAQECNTTVDALLTANPDVKITDTLSVGQILTLPAGAVCQE